MSLKVFKASAGSGKTYRLALEYIAFALSSPAPTTFAGILAVTFTNKATTEMKQRILAKLYNIANDILDGTFVEDLHRLLPDLSGGELKKRAQATLSAIVHDYDRFRVETIDSFFQSLLTNLAYEVGLPRGFKVDLDDKEIVHRAVDRMLLSIGRNKRVSARVVSLILDYMDERIEEAEGWKIGPALKEFAQKNLTKDVFLQHETEIERFLSDREQVNAFKAHLREQIKQERERIRIEVERQSTSFDITQLERLNKNTANGVVKLWKTLGKGDLSVKIGTSISKGWADNGLSYVKKGDQKDAALCELASRLAEATKALDELLEKIGFKLFTIELTLETFAPYCLLSEIGKEVTRICNERATILLSKTPDLFRRMVGNDDASFVFERAGTTFRHVMIDEFQDTSTIQWHLFQRLLIENISQGNDCMLVGDIKQSIYRWRGGDWSILRSLDSGEAPLAVNYRSLHEVVDFNNRFFTSAAAIVDSKAVKTEYARVVTDIYKGVAQATNNTRPGEGYVHAVLMGKNDSTPVIMLEDLYTQIVSLKEKQDVPLNKMLILVRNNKDAQPLIEYFSTFHPEIALTSNEAFMLESSPSVLIIIAALKHLVNEADTVALEQCRILSERLLKSYNLPRRWTVGELADLREVMTTLPLYELVRRLMKLLQVEEAEEAGAGQSSFLFTFFDKLTDYINENDARPEGFLTYWDEVLHEKAIPAEGQDAVMIMTIHKAKGLEQHTVFIPYCDWNMEADRRGNYLWCPTEGMGEPYTRLPILPFKSFSSKKVKSSAFAPTYEEEHLYMRIDELNALYVAFTRARANLYIWSREPSRLADTSVYCLLKDVFNAPPFNDFVKDNDFGGVTFRSGSPTAYHPNKVKELSTGRENPFEISHVQTLPTNLQQSPSRAVFKQSNKAKDFIADLESTESINSDSQNTERYIDRGKLLHYILSLINRPTDLHRAVLHTRRQGLFANEKEESQLESLLVKRLADQKVKEWFSGEGRLLTEASIRYRLTDGTIKEARPDRVVIKEGETVVVDYKFGTPHPDHLKQVEGYVHLLKLMGHPIVKGYLWYVYTNEIKCV